MKCFGTDRNSYDFESYSGIRIHIRTLCGYSKTICNCISVCICICISTIFMCVLRTSVIVPMKNERISDDKSIASFWAWAIFDYKSGEPVPMSRLKSNSTTRADNQKSNNNKNSNNIYNNSSNNNKQQHEQNKK